MYIYILPLVISAMSADLKIRCPKMPRKVSILMIISYKFLKGTLTNESLTSILCIQVWLLKFSMASVVG